MKTNRWALDWAIFTTTLCCIGIVIWCFIYPPVSFLLVGVVVGTWTFYGDHVSGIDVYINDEIEKEIAKRSSKK